MRLQAKGSLQYKHKTLEMDMELSVRNVCKIVHVSSVTERICKGNVHPGDHTGFWH
jgi:hypothetical protein